jgi:hypothetical protein
MAHRDDPNPRVRINAPTSIHAVVLPVPHVPPVAPPAPALVVPPAQPAPAPAALVPPAPQPLVKVEVKEEPHSETWAQTRARVRARNALDDEAAWAAAIAEGDRLEAL